MLPEFEPDGLLAARDTAKVIVLLERNTHGDTIISFLAILIYLVWRHILLRIFLK